MKKGVLLLFFLILLSLQVNAIGISPPAADLAFQPDFTYEVTFQLSNPFDFTSDVHISTSGELNEYAELKENVVVLKPRSSEQFSVLLHLPKAGVLKPGGHGLFVNAYEKPREVRKRGINAFLSVGSMIVVNVPYPGKYLETSIVAKDISKGETSPIYITVANKGRDPIQKINGKIEISYEDSEKILDIPIDTFTLEPKEQKEIRTSFSSGKNPAGTYHAVLILNYDDLISTASTKFGIGTMLVNLINHTEKLEIDKINQFFITVENKWNKPITSMHAEITVKNSGNEIAKFKTPPFELLPWEKKDVGTYIDTTGYVPGNYEATIDLYYEGEKTTETVSIALYKRFAINVTNIMIAVVILVVVIDAIVLIKRKRHERLVRHALI